jgi:anti-anti-sigma regulatory factor
MKVESPSRGAHASGLKIESRPGSNYFALIGELDLATVGRLEDTFDGIVGDGDIVFDLSRLAFADVTGLHALQRVGQFLAKRGRRLILCDPPRSLQVMVMLLGGDELLKLHLRSSSAPGQFRLGDWKIDSQPLSDGQLSGPSERDLRGELAFKWEGARRR